MSVNTGSNKKSDGNGHILDAGEKDRLIVELKNRVAVLENELRLKQDVISSHNIERERADDALREREEQFRNVFENAATGIIIADVNRGYLMVNDRFCEITGYSRNKLLTMGCEQIVHPDDQAADIAEVQRLISGEASSFMRNLRYVHASGRTVWARVNVSLMRINNHDEPRIVAVVEDITDRKRAEDALRKNEKFLNNVFNCIQDGVSVLSKDLSIIRYNPTIEKWHGKDLTGKKCYRLFHGREEPCETCPSVRAIREKTMQKEIVRDLKGWKELFAYPLVNDDGEVTGTIEQVRDITERKRAEDDIKNSELKFRTLFESASSAIFIADVETGVILDCNSNAEHLVGRHGSEIIGMHQMGLHPPENAGISRENFKRHSRLDRVTNYETKVQHKDGRQIPVILSAIPVVINSRKVMVGSFLDITERNRAEEALRESEGKFRQMAENIGEVLFIFTPDWKQTIYVSPAYERVWGRSLNDVYGNSMAWLEGVHPDDSGLPLAVVNKHIMGNFSETDTVEFRVMRPDGTVRWILARTYPVLDKQRRVCRITGIAEDITDRKRAEHEIMTAKAQSELYLDLMGHDMNNIHQIALGYLELALSVPPEARQDELLYKPMEVLQRSAQLIQNVRKLQKLHDEVFQTEPVDVAKVLSDIQRESGAVPNKTVNLNLNGCDHYHVMANELLHDVFANLVSNAIKHTGDHADIVIDLSNVNDGNGRYCRVAVEDNGPGIPDDFKDKIFNRLLKSTSKAKGMGLGLYLVKSLVDSYGGRVWVEDRVKGDHTKGARFVVMLPAADK